MYNLKKIFLMLLWIFAVTFFGNAEAAIVTDKMPLQCYVDHKVTSYDVNSGQAVGWIDADVDLVEITGIGGNGVAIGTHPSGSRRVQRLFWARDVFADTNYANRNVHVNGSHQVYRTKSSSATIGSIANEDVTVVADNGNRAQIVYRLNNGTGYKMGWVPSSVVRGGGGNVTNIKGDLNNDGRVDNADLDLMRDYMIERIGDSAINKNNADIDGNGQITVSDFSRLSDMINGPKYAQPEEGDYYIVPLNSTCAIDVPNNWHNEGNILQIYGQNQMPAQIFTIRRVGNGWYKIIHKDSGNVMNVQGGNNGNGTRLWLYHYDGTASCHWRFRDLGGGVYNIESQLPSNPFLEVQNGNPFNGAVLQLWQQHNGNSTKWTLKKASPPPTPNSVTVSLNVPYFLQKDPNWSEVMISTKSKAQGGKTIGQVGCLITALSMKYSFHTNTNTTPDIMKNKLSFGGTNGNDLYWNSVTNLGYTYTQNYSTQINNSIMSIIYRELKNGKPVIIGGKGSEGQHWVVITGYKGNSDTSFNSSNFIINDPNHTDRKTLNQFIVGHQTILRVIY